jgi:hypothetical protein
VSLFTQGLLNHGSPTHAQVAVLLELPTNAQHLVFQSDLGASRVVWGTGTVLPIDVIETLPLGVFDPVEDGAGAHAKATCRGTDRLVLADCCDHLATTLGSTVCLLMVLSS